MKKQLVIIALLFVAGSIVAIPSKTYACTIDINGRLLTPKIQFVTFQGGTPVKRTVTANVQPSKDCLGPFRVSIQPLWAGGPSGRMADTFEDNETKAYKIEYDYISPWHLSPDSMIPNGLTLDRWEFKVFDSCGSGTIQRINFCTYFEGREGLCEEYLASGSSDTTDTTQRFFGAGNRPSKISEVLGDPIVGFNPPYVSTMKAERHFTPSSPSPLSDMAVTFTAKHCPAASINGLYGGLMTKDEKGDEVYIIPGVSFTKKTRGTVEEENKISVHEFTAILPGWPNGMGTNEVLREKLIDSIAKGRRVFFRIFETADPTKKIEKDIVFNNCAQIYGGGKHSLIFERGESTQTSIASMFGLVDNGYRQAGMEKMQPYAKYKDSFKYYLDLKKIEDTEFRDVMDRIDVMTYRKYLKTWKKIEDYSSCSSGSLYTLEIDDSGLKFQGFLEGLSDLDRHIVKVLHTDQNKNVGIFMHEGGHAFGTLSDEYNLRGPGTGILLGVIPAFTNCATNPKRAYSYNNTLYGSTDIKGCMADYAGIVMSPKQGTKIFNLFRPSENSIMNPVGGITSPNVKVDRFNTVSCGWIMKQMKGGSAKSHFPECEELLKMI